MKQRRLESRTSQRQAIKTIEKSRRVAISFPQNLSEGTSSKRTIIAQRLINTKMLREQRKLSPRFSPRTRGSLKFSMSLEPLANQFLHSSSSPFSLQNRAKIYDSDLVITIDHISRRYSYFCRY